MSNVTQPEISIDSVSEKFSNNKIYVYSKSVAFLKVMRLIISVFGDIKTFKECLTSMSTHTQKMPIDVEGKSLKLLALPHLLSTQTGYYKFFPLATDKNLPGTTQIDNSGKLINMHQYPEVELLGLTFMFQLKWTEKNMYSGNRCYFEDSIQYLMNYKESNWLVAHFITVIQAILTYFENQNALAQMGVGANN